jgi:hypothetical protein
MTAKPDTTAALAPDATGGAVPLNQRDTRSPVA